MGKQFFRPDAYAYREQFKKKIVQKISKTQCIFRGFVLYHTCEMVHF